MIKQPTRLKELREQKHLTQSDLAERMGIATRQYRRYELCEQEPKLVGWIFLADFFQVSLDYLVGRSGNKRDWKAQHMNNGAMRSQPIRLKELRESRGLTQSELAQIMGIVLRQYQRYEHGEQEPKLACWIILADFYGVSLDYLIGRSDDPGGNLRA